MNTLSLRLILILFLSLFLHLALLLMPVNKVLPTGNAYLRSRLEIRFLAAGSVDSGNVVQQDDGQTAYPQRDNSLETTSLKPSAVASGTSALTPPGSHETRYYYPSRLLGQKPIILKDPLYETAHTLPSAASGRLVLTLRINEKGTMDDVIIQSASVNPSFLPQLQQAAMGMRFTPGSIDGQAVNTEMPIEVEIDNPWHEP